MLASYSRSFSGASQHSLNPGTASRSRKLLEVSFANSKKRSLSGCRVWVHEPGICVSYVRSPRTNPLREQSKFATTRWKVFISHCKISPSQAIFKVLQNNACVFACSPHNMKRAVAEGASEKIWTTFCDTLRKVPQTCAEIYLEIYQ